MTAAEIFTLARLKTHSTDAQIVDTIWVEPLNIVYKRIFRSIVTELGENYFKTETLDDAAVVADGSFAYTVPATAAVGLWKILRLDIKPTVDYVTYVPAKEVKLEDLRHSWDFYLLNQPLDKPIYYTTEDKIFIAPAWIADNVGPGTNNQIKITNINSVIDITATATEAQILLPVDFHYLIALGLAPAIYEHRGKLTDKNDINKDYKEGLREMIETLSDRVEADPYRQVPNTSNLEF